MNILFLQSVRLLRLSAFISLFSALSFQVKSQDTIPPSVTCINGLSINHFNNVNSLNLMITLWATDFLDNATDNVSSFGALRFAIRKSGTGSGFPMTNNVPQASVTFNCGDLGTNLVELWVMDEAGNSDFCETYILIQDNIGNCEPPLAIFSGQITTDQLDGVEDVLINLSFVSVALPGVLFSVFSNQNGDYSIPNPLAIPASFEIKPKLDTDPLNGVNTWDLVLISRHILNLQPLNTPYKIIAADANKSGTVTTFDIVELRKLLLGTYTALPNNTSWRFIDKSQMFTNNENPFADILRESIPLLDLTGGNTLFYDFVGVKIGDLDNTAIPHSLLSSYDRDAPFTAFHITRNDANNWLVSEGETVELTFANPTALSGYQMTLETDGLQPTEVVPGTGMSADNFALFDHAVTTVFEQGNAPFSVRFNAEKSGALRDMIEVSSKITPTLAFGENGEKMQVNLFFEGEKSSISPNPWSDHTCISFHTSEATSATLKVFDMAGRLVYTNTNNVEKGEQAFELNSAQVPITGILFYEITTKEHSITGKTVKNNISHH